MSTSADSRDSRTSLEDLAAIAPADLAGEIRAATARMYTYAQVRPLSSVTDAVAEVAGFHRVATRPVETAF